MLDVQLIATDMDHTLLTEAGELPPHFDQKLDALAAAGIQFAIASGRPLYTLKAIFPKHADQLVLISDNGGVIADRGKIVAKNLLPQSAIQQMVQTALAHTDVRPMICGINGAIAPTVDRQYDTVYREFYHNLDYLDDLTQWQGEADKVTLYLPNGDAERVFAEIIQPQFGDQFSAAVSGPVWIDIMPQNVNKGTAMAQIGKLRGIAPEHMMAFGDTFNDAQMLSFVKYGYLMANANPGMASYAHLHTGSNDEYGVVQVLDQVLAGKFDTRD
ncbi:HAD family hydrolase [Lacticaseibacillus porcinae]|uniref:HAD family hydrolase n=1 Tax=Lacticaseibacillus porcinae TaxID=1123687 RepID=UPI0013DDA67C|nr:HAD family hydrolase [Lacticaseibacillus porcinae]